MEIDPILGFSEVLGKARFSEALGKARFSEDHALGVDCRLGVCIVSAKADGRAVGACLEDYALGVGELYRSKWSRTWRRSNNLYMSRGHLAQVC
jgi:hypothetical protein